MSISELSKPADVNDAQWQAIIHEDSHLLIVAGPGTGKTHTITHRIAHLQPQLKNDECICAITFTNKAALEMKERLDRRLSGQTENIFVGTFHGFCLDLLKKYSSVADVPDGFQVASPEMIDELFKEAWPETKSKERKERLKRIWKSKTKGEESSDIEAYNRTLRQRGIVDFDDLLLETLKVLENETVINEFHDTFRYIFVDEYQDINAVQHLLLQKLVGPLSWLTAIGDPNQAIYGFRGNDVSFFNRFTQDFPGAVELSLADNYRSAQNLLTASGQVLEKGEGLKVPDLTAQMYEEGRLTIYQAPTEKAEAEYVVHTIEKMIGGTSMFSQDSGRVGSHLEGERSFGDIAVLYRLNSQQYSLKAALERSGIPYEISGTRALEDELLTSPDDRYEERTEKVKLMTLHASKGLEFPVVFIIGCEEGLLPLEIEAFSSDESEERRLFYVGMTRAKEQLLLLSAARRVLFGKILKNATSRFVHDIEEELKEIDAVKRKKKKKDDQLDLFGKF